MARWEVIALMKQMFCCQPLPSSTSVGCQPTAVQAPKAPTSNFQQFGRCTPSVCCQERLVYSAGCASCFARVLFCCRRRRCSPRKSKSSHFLSQGVAEAFLHCSTFRMLRPLVGPLAVDLCRPLGIKIFERFLSFFKSFSIRCLTCPRLDRIYQR